MVDHEPRPRLLPRLLPLNSPGYYVFLALVAVLILGPLGGITASYMNFSLGFFVGGQVLAGILGSTITYFYGPEGKHGANYMQTAAASVASMAAMGVLIQAMVWLGLPEPPTWHLFLYFLCVGMFGVGVGMLYTPLLVDKLRLTYPSGLAVANILRALTDVRLLKASVGKLFGGMGVGAALPILMDRAAHFPWVQSVAATNVATSTVGAGMIVGARVGIPAIVYAFVWSALTPWMRDNGWLGPDDPFRKFAFLVALGTIMGAAVVDITLILREALQRLRGRAAGGEAAEGPPVEEWKRTNTTRLLLWLAFWMAAVVVVTAGLMHVPLGWVLLCVALAFVMMLVNGISLGITDWNPISSAFVIAVVVMAAIGLLDPIAGLLAGSIVFVGCAVGGDMQQDRSTGWRLGTNRTNQFRFQVVGILLGAVLAVFMAKLFMDAYPVLRVDTFSHPEQKVAQWQSAMTYKFVGALRGLTSPSPHQIPAMLVGFGIGLVIEIVRKLVKKNERYKAWSKQGGGSTFDFVFDCVLLPSPYASSFAGFVELPTSLWFGGGSVISWAWNGLTGRQAKRNGAEALPEDMSTTSLVGGGLIAGDSIAALILGVIGLMAVL
ncbi:MAG: peptide transporter [Planctomycetes bacterium]|nr:peptide transporter [Planctomycetota bacterium]